MQRILFNYGSSDYDFLDVLETQCDPSELHFIVEVGSASTCNIDYNDSLVHCSYNFAYASDFRTRDPWVIDGVGKVPTFDTKLFIINNLPEAREIFKLAKVCREHSGFYTQLFNTGSTVMYDNAAISVANSIYSSPYGFFDIPKHSIIGLPKIRITKSTYFEQSQSAVVHISGVNTIE